MNFPSSQRLTFHQWTPADLPELLELNSNAQTMRHFPTVDNQAQAEQQLAGLIEHFNEYSFTYYLVREKEQESFIGFIGCKWQHFDHPSCPHVDIGWRLLPAFWGKGFATEGARACLSFMSTHLEQSNIYSTAPSANLASLAVMRKIGMKFQEKFLHPALQSYPELHECQLFKIANLQS